VPWVFLQALCAAPFSPPGHRQPAAQGPQLHVQILLLNHVELGDWNP